NSGNPADGFVTAGSNGVPWNTYNTSSISYAPRLGFAYDLFGNCKTAIRGGVGVFFDRLDGNEVYSMASNPPIVYAPTAYYGQLPPAPRTPYQPAMGRPPQAARGSQRQLWRAAGHWLRHGAGRLLSRHLR